MSENKDKVKEYIDNFPEGKIFAPNSISHMWPNTSRWSKKFHLRVELERMRDFVEWLFEDENIHWMSQSEAWRKFDEKEVEELLNE